MCSLGMGGMKRYRSCVVASLRLASCASRASSALLERHSIYIRHPISIATMTHPTFSPLIAATPRRTQRDWIHTIQWKLKRQQNIESRHIHERRQKLKQNWIIWNQMRIFTKIKKTLYTKCANVTDLRLYLKKNGNKKRLEEKLKRNETYKKTTKSKRHECMAYTLTHYELLKSNTRIWIWSSVLHAMVIEPIFLKLKKTYEKKPANKNYTKYKKEEKIMISIIKSCLSTK